MCGSADYAPKEVVASMGYLAGGAAATPTLQHGHTAAAIPSTTMAAVANGHEEVAGEGTPQGQKRKQTTAKTEAMLKGKQQEARNLKKGQKRRDDKILFLEEQLASAQDQILSVEEQLASAQDQILSLEVEVAGLQAHANDVVCQVISSPSPSLHALSLCSPSRSPSRYAS